MNELVHIKCVPCRSGSPLVTAGEMEGLLPLLPQWKVIHINGVKHLKREFGFSNFAQALVFTNQVGQIAEEEGHHPAIVTEWGKVTVEWWTHKIEGLHMNDFVMAAQTDNLFLQSD